MKLKDYYLSLSSEEKKELATTVGAELSYLRHLAYERKQPGHSLAKRIEAATGGKVSRNELRPDIWESRPAHG